MSLVAATSALYVVEKVDDNLQLVEIHLVDHDSKLDLKILPRLIQRGGDVSSTLLSVSNAIKSYVL